MEPARKPPLVPPAVSGLTSLLVPGLGQLLQREFARGAGLLATVLVLATLIIWQKMPLLFVPLAAVWLWGGWDAFRRARGRPSGTTAPFLLAALVVYALGAKATELRPGRLFTNWPAMKPIAGALVRPELLARPTHDRIGAVPLQVPCVQPLPPPEASATVTPTLRTSVACAAMGETIALEGEGFFPDFEVEIWWQNPIGDYQKVIVEGKPLVAATDAQGHLQVSLNVPTTAVPLDRLPGPGQTQTHRIEARQHQPYGALAPTQTLTLVLNKTGETIALAFVATVLAVVLALPVSLLAARNLMWGNWFTRVVYYVARTTLNVIRSIETLIWAIIFVVWVGVGPFAGVLAILLHSIAALGKLYSEAIESIDPGPIEAVRATGANWVQVVVYAVWPQFMPSFLSFTLYRWDINVRMSTVIGLVCDAGLGFLVVQWIRLGKFSAMATSIIAIVLVIAILDYLSAALRKRIIEGVPPARRQGRLRRYALPVVIVAGFAAFLTWSWNVAQINLPAFAEGAGAGLRKSREYLTPELLSRPTEPVTVTAVLPVPCGSAEPVAGPLSGPRVDLSLSCGSAGETLVISGHELPPSARVSVRWVRADGAFLRVKENCCDTDAAGGLRLETRIHPLLEIHPEQGQTIPGQVQIYWERVVGGYRISQATKSVFSLALVTLLMGLVATTLGSLFAVPISFLAARNVVGRSPFGRAAYTVTRTVLNLWRAIEPLILALVFASWVGFGPSAGVLAMAMWNIPNLAKLFSETIEEIDPGPVEAVTATGANRLQTLLYAVVPQLIPGFLAFILYQWDINLRMSTIIGFVGGGGIGQQFQVWVGLDEFGKAAIALWVIVAMVWGMDYVSARVRERLVGATR